MQYRRQLVEIDHLVRSEREIDGSVIRGGGDQVGHEHISLGVRLVADGAGRRHGAPPRSAQMGRGVDATPAVASSPAAPVRPGRHGGRGVAR